MRRGGGEELEKGLDAPSGFLFPAHLRLVADSCAVRVRSSWQRGGQRGELRGGAGGGRKGAFRRSRGRKGRDGGHRSSRRRVPLELTLGAGPWAPAAGDHS